MNNADRQRWLGLLGEVCARHNWLCHAYCLMDNHFHIVIETVDGNLSAGMRQLNVEQLPGNGGAGSSAQMPAYRMAADAI